MKKSLVLLLSASLCSVTAPSALAKTKVPYTHEGFYTNAPTQKAVHFVDIAGIKKSLEGKPPMTVSFDVDDTSVFSSSYFHYGFTFGDKFGWGSNPKEVLHNQGFWDYIAEQADKHSIPKQSAKDLMKMHLERGDKIVFVTGRTKHSKAENGTVTETAKVLQQYFGLPKDTVIWYTENKPINGYKYPKTAYIVKSGSQLHYGDSDDDILSAREAGIRGIRVQRSYSSTNPQKMNGGYGEEVLINSAW